MAKHFCTNVKECKRCGKCCIHLREKDVFTETEDLKIRKNIFLKKGVLYLYPMERYGLSITKEEADIMQKEAKKQGIKLEIIPKKILIKENGEAFAFDFAMDHEICPFYKDKSCLIYELRPKVCKAFPIISNLEPAELDNFLNKIKLKNLSFEEALECARKEFPD